MNTQTHATKSILISRTDNIGDVVLTLPLAFALKRQHPDLCLVFLGRAYTQAIAERCPAIDRFVDWDQLSKRSQEQQIQSFKDLGVEQIFHVFPNKSIAKLAYTAKVPQRVGTNRRWYHWLYCNHLKNISRKSGTQHESLLNLDLLDPSSSGKSHTLSQLRQDITLVPSSQRSSKLRAYLDNQRFNVLIHPYSFGSARDWKEKNFLELIHQLHKRNIHVLISGSQKESVSIQKKLLPFCPEVTDLSGKLSLHELIDLIGISDGLVVGSTGPLHIGAALGQKVVGLFPAKNNMNPQRWGPIGKNASYLVAKKECNRACSFNNCDCMDTITVDNVLDIITMWQKEKNDNS